MQGLSADVEAAMRARCGRHHQAPPAQAMFFYSQDFTEATTASVEMP